MVSKEQLIIQISWNNDSSWEKNTVGTSSCLGAVNYQGSRLSQWLLWEQIQPLNLDITHLTGVVISVEQLLVGEEKQPPTGLHGWMTDVFKSEYSEFKVQSDA